jgi:hypothetical protein
MKPAPDLTGNRYFRLIVLERGSRYGGVLYWRCRCDCGKELEVKAQSLRSGNTGSCGCYAREVRTHKTGGAAFRRVLRSYKWGANRRGLEWGLTEEQFRALITSPCYYTGLPPSNVMKAPSTETETFTYSGIDRLDNTKGYITGNCVPCCGFVNRAKSDMKHDEFIEMCRLVANTTSQPMEG